MPNFVIVRMYASRQTRRMCDMEQPCSRTDIQCDSVRDEPVGGLKSLSHTVQCLRQLKVSQ
jgi:hypothetical protein